MAEASTVCRTAHLARHEVHELIDVEHHAGNDGRAFYAGEQLDGEHIYTVGSLCPYLLKGIYLYFSCVLFFTYSHRVLPFHIFLYSHLPTKISCIDTDVIDHA